MNHQAVDDVDAVIAELETEYTTLTEFDASVSDGRSLPPGCSEPL